MFKHLALIVCLVACEPRLPSTVGPPPATTVTPPPATTLRPCQPPWCPGNSPEIAGMGFWELNLDHWVNTQGFRLLGMSHDHKFYDLDVQNNGELIAKNNAPLLRGTHLQGATLWLQKGGAQFGIFIKEVGHAREVVDPDGNFAPGAEVYTYLFQWSQVVSSPLQGFVHDGKVTIHQPRVPEHDETAVEPDLGPDNLPVCPTWDAQTQTARHDWTPPLGGSVDRNGWSASDAWDESTVIPPFNAVVFEGDRFDDIKRTVSQTADDRWFNIGCVRHALSKMRITRNTLHTANGNWRQVQATLKMLSGDYCGDGKAFTVTGTPIVWQQHPSGMGYAGSPGVLEARWDENGAICFGTPRLALHPAAQFPDIVKEIRKECPSRKLPPVPPNRNPELTRPSTCSQADLSLHLFGELITTANYNEPTP